MYPMTSQFVPRIPAAIRAIILSVVAGGLSLLMVTPSSATVISANHLVFGVGSLTRDTDQGLDFLDLTLSTNRSFNDVAGEFGVAGDYEGFRHATELEVIALVNNFGFSPTVTPGAGTLGDTGGDQLSVLVNLVGVTEQLLLFPPIDRAKGVTGDFVFGTSNRLVTFQDAVIPAADDGVDTGAAQDQSTPDLIIGNWLVQASPAVPVPEPATLTLFGTGILGLMGWTAWRKRR